MPGISAPYVVRKWIWRNDPVWDKMRNCDCGVIDTSPSVNQPYCIIYGEDFDCDRCTATQVEKDEYIKRLEE